MNIYDEKQNILSLCIKELSNGAYYQEIKLNLKKLISQENNGGDNEEFKKIIKDLINYIKSAPELLDTRFKITSKFIHSPIPVTVDNKIFKLIYKNIDNVNDIINKSEDDSTKTQLKEIINHYSKSHRLFIENLVTSRNLTTTKTSEDILKPLPILIGEDLKLCEIKSIELAYQMTSYDPLQHQFVKKNKDGTSFGRVINEKMYLKVDNGSGLLNPSKEYAVFQFYKNLFSSSQTALVSPTQLLLVNQLRILNINSEVINVLGEYKTRYDTIILEKVLEKEPDFRSKLEHALEHSETLPVQASLLSNGQPLGKYIECLESVGIDSPYGDIDFESFSSHFIASLLLLPTDYKSDNLFLENGTGVIVGIDNDEVLESFEFKRSLSKEIFIKFKNILFTLKPLMVKPIHDQVRNQIIKHNPNLFILKWLLNIQLKQENYQSLCSFGGYHTQSSLKIPMQFNKGWITLMLSRFHLIKSILLKDDENITHENLFKQIHPFTSIYYELLSKVHEHPLDQIASISRSEYSFKELVNEYPPSLLSQIEINVLLNEIETLEIPQDIPISIDDTIKELITNTSYSDFSGDNSLAEFINLILTNEHFIDNDDNGITFHSSWHKFKLSILFDLLKSGISIGLVDKFIKYIKIEQNDIDNEPLSIIHSVVRSNNSNVIDQIDYLITNFNIDIEIIEDNSTIFDLSVDSNNFNLFKWLIGIGAGKNSNNIPKITGYYNNLSNGQKLELKPYLEKLFQINPKINWEISLNELLPIFNKNNDDHKNPKCLNEVSGIVRIIPNEYWDQLFNSKGIPNESKGYGTRIVRLISDKFGNGIYFKFEPQFPGTELAVTKLSESLFGFLSPYCKVASINNLPVLLIQQVPGKTLYDILEDVNQSNNIINHIESSNLSKQLIMAMLSNNADGNLGNFIITNTDSNSYKLYSIDNDQSFMPSVVKSLGMFGYKKSLQVETALFLFNQMNDPVHQDVINIIKNLDIFKLLTDWLSDLGLHHQNLLDQFKSIQNKYRFSKKTIIGISFNKGMITQLYSKLQGFKKHLSKNYSKPITHFELLELLEPLIANRYKQYLFSNSNDSIKEKFGLLKNISANNSSMYTCTNHPTSDVLESMEIPNSGDIQNELWNGNFGPKQALEELKSLDDSLTNYQQLMETILNGGSPSLSDFGMECLLKNTDFSSFTNKPPLYHLFRLIVNKQLKNIRLKNCYSFTSVHMKRFNLDSMINIDLSGSTINRFDNIGLFKSLKGLKLIGCLNLTTVNLDAPNLKALNLSKCKLLNFIKLNHPSSLNNLNISFTNFKEITLEYQNLKCLNIQSMDNLKKINFSLPSIETIGFEYCKSLKEIFSTNFNIKLHEALFHPKNQNIIRNQNICVNLGSKEINTPIPDSSSEVILFGSDYYSMPILDSENKPLFGINIFYKSHLSFEPIPQSVKLLILGDGLDQIPVIPKKNSITELYIYDIKQPLSIVSIPDGLMKLVFHNGFNHELTPGIIPEQIKELVLYDIKKPLVINSIPYGLIKLDLKDGFNQILIPGVIPNSIEELYIGNIKQPLSKGSIQEGLKKLVLHNGFNHELTPGIIPSSIQELELWDIEQPLLIGSIPNGLKKLVLHNGFKHGLSIGIIPNSIDELHIHDIKKSLSIESIPVGLKKLILHNGFNQILTPGIIPNSVNELHIHDIQQLLLIGSIHSGLTKLVLHNGFNNELTPGIIPNSIDELHIHDIQKPLLIGSIPNGLTKLVLHSGFNQILTLGIIPSSIYELKLWDIKKPLLIGSIPNELRVLSLMDGFNQILTPGIIPNSIDVLKLWDIKKPLLIGSIPNELRVLSLMDGFNQTLTPGIITNSIDELELWNIKQPLIVGSIPNGLNKLVLHNGFNQILSSGIIPNSIGGLELWDIKRSLVIGSIPEGLKKLTLHNGFNQILTPGIIPNSIYELFIRDIKQPLLIGSIPVKLGQLILCDGFNQILTPGIIPNSIDVLHIFDINQQLLIGSIPNGLEKLILHNGFNQALTPGLIPNSIKELSIYDIKQPLLEGSIPSGLRVLSLHNGFNYALTPGIIPNSIKELSIYDIKQPLLEGSIPNGLKVLSLHNGFNQALTPGIIPNLIDELSIWGFCQPLLTESIPNGLKKLILCDGFDHELTSGIIPNSIDELHVWNIKKPLLIESIPNGLKKLILRDGFNHELKPGIIPNSIEVLIVCDIKKPLLIGSIPNGLKKLVFQERFNHELTSSIIPNFTEELHIWDIKKPLLIESIPNGLKKLVFHNGFNHELTPGIIKNSIDELHLWDIKQPLLSGSIPDGLKKLDLRDGFNQILTPGIIPNSIDEFHLWDIKKPLLIGSIPNELRKLVLHNGFNQELSPGIIPNSLEVLTIWNIKQPLLKGSIPVGLKKLILEDRFDQILTPGIIPNSIEVLTICDVKQPLLKGSIPVGLKVLRLEDGFNHELTPGIIPNSISIIYHNKCSN